jgi:hypothetical protein
MADERDHADGDFARGQEESDEHQHAEGSFAEGDADETEA